MQKNVQKNAKKVCFVTHWKWIPIKKSFIFLEKKDWKSFVVQKIALPLYSLSGSNAQATLNEEQDDPWKHSIQTSSTTCFCCFDAAKDLSISKERKTNRQIIWCTLIPASIKIRLKSLIEITNKNLQRRVWSWLRMNASYRLNTCKSRGFIKEACFFDETTGARVSNAYPTCLSYWDSLSKERLIPNNILWLHDNNMKAPAMKDGDAFH